MLSFDWMGWTHVSISVGRAASFTFAISTSTRFPPIVTRSRFTFTIAAGSDSVVRVVDDEGREVEEEAEGWAADPSAEGTSSSTAKI